MSRTARRNHPGGVYHLISRFVDQRWLIRDDEERQTYLRMLGSALAHSDWRCLAYAVMSSHIHFAMIAGAMPMSTWTKAANSPFANWLNRRHRRLGPVFSNRIDDYGVPPRYTGRLLAYIHNNPVRAGVVARARESTWTSHRAYAGLVSAPRWLDVSLGMDIADFEDGASFDTWVDVTPGERCSPPRRSHRRAVRRLGGVEMATPNTDLEVALIPLVARPYAHIRPDPRRVVALVCLATGMDAMRLASRRRLPEIQAARAIVVHCGLALGLTQSQLAAALGLSSQGVHAISRRRLGGREQGTVELVTDQLVLERGKQAS